MPRQRISFGVVASFLISGIFILVEMSHEATLVFLFNNWFGWSLVIFLLLAFAYISWWIQESRRQTTIRFAQDGVHIVTRKDNCIPWSKLSSWTTPTDLQQSKPLYFLQRIFQPAHETFDSVILIKSSAPDNALELNILRTIPIAPLRFKETTEALSVYLPRHAMTPQAMLPKIGKSTPMTKRVIKVFLYIGIGVFALAVVGIILAVIESL